jgi:hypothetical protein
MIVKNRFGDITKVRDAMKLMWGCKQVKDAASKLK